MVRKWVMFVTGNDVSNLPIISDNTISFSNPANRTTVIFDCTNLWMICLLSERMETTGLHRGLAEDERQIALPKYTGEPPPDETELETYIEQSRTWNEAWGNWFANTLSLGTIGGASYYIGIPFLGEFFEWSWTACATILRLLILQDIPGRADKLMVTHLGTQKYFLLNRIPGQIGTYNTYKPALFIGMISFSSVFYYNDIKETVITTGTGMANSVVDTFFEWRDDTAETVSKTSKAAAGTAVAAGQNISKNVLNPVATGASYGLGIGLIAFFVLWGLNKADKE